MATAKVDHISNISATEEDGKVTKLTRVAFIDGLTDPADAGDLVEQMLGATGMPAAASQVEITIGAVVSTLTLRRRVPQYANGDAKVTLEYEAGGEDDGSGGTTVKLRKGGRCGLNQREVYRKRDGSQITVTFDGESQSGAIAPLLPATSPWYETIEKTSSPETLAAGRVGRVNNNTWKGKDAGHWLVADAEWEPISSSEYRFRWSVMESQEDEGWLPIAVFIDPETGKPPEGISGDDGTNGILKVPYYSELDFTVFDTA